MTEKDYFWMSLYIVFQENATHYTFNHSHVPKELQGWKLIHSFIKNKKTK